MPDNLEEKFENKEEDFAFSCHVVLKELFEVYCGFLMGPQIQYYKYHNYLTKDDYRRKYLFENFTDKVFAKKFSDALTEKDFEKLFLKFKELTCYVLDEVGGFDIDGWKLRSKLSL